MTQTAIVSKILPDGYAQVDVERISACGKSCASCGAGCASKQIISVKAQNTVSARIGDRVYIESSTKGIMGAAFLVYIVPITLFFIFYVAASMLFSSETAAIIVSLVAFFIGAAGVYVYNRYVRRDKDIEHKIIGLLDDSCLGM